MKYVPSPPELIEFFDRLLPDDPDIKKRKMFGYPCCFINGNLAAGLHADNLLLRLSEADRSAFLKLPESKIFEPMPGRPMKEYVLVPAYQKHATKGKTLAKKLMVNVLPSEQVWPSNISTCPPM
jgi:hypothetical protein